MTRLLREAAFMAMLVVTAPVWAQVPMTAEGLNRQELSWLAQAQQPGPVAPPNTFVADPVGLIVADGVKYQAPGFPGFVPLLGIGLVGAGSVVNTVVVGVPLHY